MKILQINKYYYVRSGAEESMLNTCALLRKHGHQIIPFSMESEKNVDSEYRKYFVKSIEYDKEIDKSIFRKLYLGLKVIYSFEAKNKTLKLIDKTKPDIAHIHKFNNTLTPSILYGLKKRNVPIVQTLRDYRTVCPNYNLYDLNRGEVCEDCKGHRYFNAVRRKCQKSSYLVGLNIAIESYLYHFLRTYEKTIDLFIAPSDFLRKKMIEFGIDEKKIVHIPNFIRCEKYVPDYNGSDYILYLGRVEKHKGIKTLIDAVKSCGSAKLQIVGTGDYVNDMKKYVKENNISNVFLSGFKSGGDLLEVIKGSLFTIVPSEWYENNPRSVLESFASGKPVIGSKMGGIPELIDGGNDGLLFKTGDVNDLAGKINYMLNNKQIINEMGRNARKKIEENYNENVHYEKLMEAYKKVI